VINVTTVHALAYGISATYSTLPEIRDVQVDVSGGNTSYGIYAEPRLDAVNVHIINSSIRSVDYGVYADGCDVTVEHSQVRATDSLGIGIRAHNVMVDNSIIEGDKHTVYPAWTAAIGASRLDGGPVLAGAICAGVYDESFIFYASTCP
jgi:hypothetical protein